jgi:oxygen-independent coproporphyrinogen III oxidase
VGGSAAAPAEREQPWLGPRAAYVHVPFCRTKCLYCDFNTYAGKERLTGEYVAALNKEIRRRTGEGAGFLRSVYFGGGTPSLLPLSSVRRLMGALQAGYGVAAGAEVTLEANPGTFGARYLEGLLAAGVNRLSLGVQSLDDETLRRLARTHSAATAIEALHLARRAGLPSVSLDLIYGLPWQTLEGWRDHLRRALDSDPDHISLYALMVEEGTPLATLVARGSWTVPDDDLVADMYEAALPLLSGAGYEHYEVSNWARPGHASRHNLVYWRNEAYLGFGAGAHSYAGGRRSWNVKPIEGYIQRIARREDVTGGAESLPAPATLGETAALALRLRQEGIDFRRFGERFGIDPRRQWGPALAELRETGLLAQSEERLTLTDAGLLVSNEVASRFL